MSDLTPASGSSAEVAKMAKEVESFDPGLGSYNFGNLGHAVEFAKLMCRSGPMLPSFAQNNPALCLGLTMRATHWGFDPYALAMEAFQAKDGGPVGFQAKVFVAALRQRTGITLKYRFDGKLEPTGKPVLSHKGNKIAEHGWKGDLRCIAYATVDGEVLEWESPPYDMIGIKNSPLWFNDPYQQLRYMAGRGWTRAYRPDVMLGAYSDDEIEEMRERRAMRDVTPEAPAERLKRITRSDAATEPSSDGPTLTPDEGDSAATDEPTGSTDESEASAPDEEERPTPEALAKCIGQGQDAALEGFPPRDACPYPEGSEEAEAWLSGYDAVMADFASHEAD